MTSPRSTTVDRLRRLDSSSHDFSGQLNDILEGEEYRIGVSTLQGDDLASLVDFFDELLDHLCPSSAASKMCRSELGEICSSRAALPRSYTLSPDDLQVSPEPWASGGYGDVYLASFDASRACVKRVRVPHPKYIPATEKEFCKAALKWKHLKHPNLVPLLGFTVSPLQLVSGWMPNGNLPEYIEKNRCADVVKLLSDAAKGICYLHSCEVVHREIKGSNVLVDAAGHARITDFGLATITAREDFAMGPYQPEYSQRWNAPEVLGERKYTKAADIFSFGMLMVEAFTGTVPFSDLSGFNAALAITRGKRPHRPTHPAVSGLLWKLIQQCWDSSPHMRPSAAEVLQSLLPLNLSGNRPARFGNIRALH